jgi:hypothetical protein
VSPFPVIGLQFSADGRSVALGTEEAAMRWSVSRPSRPKRVAWKASSHDHAWAISPDTTTVASIGSQGVEIRDLATGALRGTVAEGAGTEQLLGFSTDSSTVVAWDGSAIRAIDVADGSTQTLGTAHREPDTSVGFDDPGAAFTKDLVLVQTTTGRYERTERFALSRSAALDRICEVVGRNLTRSEWARYAPGVAYRTLCSRWPTPAA